MIRTALAATTLLLAAVSAAAQTQQEALDARYNRALAAGYKALMLCGAISSAEANGAERSAESVIEWELVGIQTPFDAVVAELPHEIVRGPSGKIAHVAVRWAEDMPPRIAVYRGPQTECAVQPLGLPEGPRSGAAPGLAVSRDILPPKEEGMMPGGRAGLDLAASVKRALAPDGYGKGVRTTRVLVMHEGTTLADGYSEDFAWRTPQRTWSVAKSIAATLVGAAVYRGEADVNASAGLGLADNDPRRAITIDHLLRMASGRHSDTPGNRTDPLYFGGASMEEVALDWPLIAAPGSTFRYANNDTLAAVASIKATFAAHPPAEFFAKLGMIGTVAETDWQGDYVLSSQVWATADDLAGLRVVDLNDGNNPSGTRILP